MDKIYQAQETFLIKQKIKMCDDTEEWVEINNYHNKDVAFEDFNNYKKEGYDVHIFSITTSRLA